MSEKNSEISEIKFRIFQVYIHILLKMKLRLFDKKFQNFTKKILKIHKINWKITQKQF